MVKQSDELVINSLVGEEAEFHGEIRVKGLLRIDGYFKGLLVTEGKILIGEKGVVETDIRAGTVVVAGEVRGSIIAKDRVTLLSTCRVYGNIVSRYIHAEKGVVFEGNCKINQD